MQLKRSIVFVPSLIAKLIISQAPLAFIRILFSWYGLLQCSVVWNSLLVRLLKSTVAYDKVEYYLHFYLPFAWTT